MIALFGLVGKNAILLVDRANDLRRTGMEREEALEQAGPHRLRPILMTSAVLIFSMLPVALELGDGASAGRRWGRCWWAAWRPARCCRCCTCRWRTPTSTASVRW